MTDIYPGAKYIQLEEWGFPKGVLRPVPPVGKAFSVIHITGNSRLPSAEGEAAWRLNDLGLQNSATFFVNRDGSMVQVLGDPIHMAPWANGDVNQPDMRNDRIAAAIHDGVNANTRTILAIENVGFEPGSPLTQAQERACGELIAYYHRKAGVSVSRESVIGHYQLNSVTRPNCPAHDKSVIDRIVRHAQSLGEDEDMIEDLQQRVAYWRELAEGRATRIEDLEARRDGLVSQVTTMQQTIATLEGTIEQMEASADMTDDLRRTVRALRSRVATLKAIVASAAEAAAAA